MWPWCSSSLEIIISQHIWEPEYIFIKIWDNGPIYYWKIWDRTLFHFYPTSALSLLHFQMSVELKICYLKTVFLGHHTFTPCINLLTFGVPEILQLIPMKIFRTFREISQNFFQAQFFIWIPGDYLKFEKYIIITKKYFLLRSIKQQYRNKKKQVSGSTEVVLKLPKGVVSYLPPSTI